MKCKRAVVASLLFAASVCAWTSIARADDDRDDHRRGASAATIAARQKFFGAENVNPSTGAVDRHRVIFAWVTNASLAASIEGRIVLLDTYINRLELPPPAGVSDLRRTP